MSWQSGSITIDGVRLAYERSGGALPPLVLVHGMTDYGRYWMRVARALEDEYEVIIYDMRGHGHSDTPDHGYTPDDYAGDLLGLIRALELERPAVIGHSLGAATVAAAAAIDSSALRCIVLEDPPWRIPATDADPAPALTFAEAWRASITELQSLDHAGRVVRCRAEHPTWIDEECDYWAESKALVRPQIFGGFLALMTQPWQTLAARIACPALLITGDPALGGIVTAEVAEEFARLAPHGRTVSIPGAGHGIHREQLDAFIAATREVLRS